MIAYPNFAAAIAGVDLVELAIRSGVGLPQLEAIAAGRIPPGFGAGAKLAAALGADPATLWLLDEDGEEGLAHVPTTRYVTDPETLRACDGRRSA